MNTINNNQYLMTLALQVARGQVGQAEQPKGSNRGPMVGQYLTAVGLQPGYAWCQAFMYWCYNEAAKQLNLSNPMVKTASVSECWNKAKAKMKVTKEAAIPNITLIQPGAQFILLFDNGTGHTGMVERVEHTKTGIVLHTIEGNSNNDGNREGLAVVRHIRKLADKSLKGFIKYT